MDDVDPYRSLRVPTTVTDKDLDAAYKRMALASHPDRHGGDTRLFQEVQSSYATLKDPTTREAYDRKHGLNVGRRLGVWMDKAKRERETQQEETVRHNNTQEEELPLPPQDSTGEYVPENAPASSTGPLGEDEESLPCPDAVTYDVVLTRLEGPAPRRWGIDLNRNMTVTKIDPLQAERVSALVQFATVTRVSGNEATFSALRAVTEESVTLRVKVAVKRAVLKRVSQEMSWGFSVHSGTLQVISMTPDGPAATQCRETLERRRILFVGGKFIESFEDLKEALEERKSSTTLVLVVAYPPIVI